MKSTLGALLIAIIICGAALAGTGSFQTASASKDVIGIISSDTTWTKANSPYPLTGNVLVSKGKTLTIEPGATVSFNGYYIMVNGTLRAQGTTAEKTSFNGGGSITYTSFSTAWNEQSGSGCIIENGIFHLTSIVSDNAVKISGCTLDAGISGGSSAIIVHCVIQGSVSGDAISDNTIIGEVRGNTISGSTITGDVYGNTISNNNITGVVHGVTVSGNAIAGCVIAKGNCTIKNNFITRGIGIEYGADASGVNIVSEMFSDGGYPTVQNNLITNCAIGVNIDVFIRNWFSINIPLVQNNMITKNSVGIKFVFGTQENYYPGTPTVIQDNTISNNSIGIKLESSEHLTIRNNNIQDNSEYNVYGGPNFDMPYNWWGTTNTSTIERSIYDYNEDFNLGKITFVPFLTEPNPQAIPDPNVPLPISDSSTSTSPSPSPEPEPTTSPSPDQNSTTTPGQANIQNGNQEGFNEIEIAILAVLVVIAVSLIVLVGLVLKKRQPPKSQ